jgi:hypothetical protein
MFKSNGCDVTEKRRWCSRVTVMVLPLHSRTHESNSYGVTSSHSQHASNSHGVTSSQSYTRAWPAKLSPSLPVILATEPPGKSENEGK